MKAILGSVFSCFDVWGNYLAAKVLKPIGTYDHVKASAQAELGKLAVLRHPNITYVFDAFEYRDTFYIVTERCYCPLTQLSSQGLSWVSLANAHSQVPVAGHTLHPPQSACSPGHTPGQCLCVIRQRRRCAQRNRAQFSSSSVTLGSLDSSVN